jgi:hypothetical protein
MQRVEKQILPDHALLQSYRKSGAYTDCYCTSVGHNVSQSDYVFAFYTTWLFKLERIILKLVSRPSTDDDARRLADAEQDSFAAWTVEARNDNQLLMCDFRGRTRSWLMTESEGDVTRLYFGSAVVPVATGDAGEPELGSGFNALLGFHKLYSRALLSAAMSRLARRA